jgi:hypothetical protein
MTTNEMIRIFDIGAHIMIFVILAHIAVHVNHKEFWTRVLTVASSFLSLFLAATCWQYGRTPTFLMAHAAWELVVGVNLIMMFKKYEAEIRE